MISSLNQTLHFNIGGSEWIILIFIVIFLLFGAKKVPELARSIGKAAGEFERGKLELQREIQAATQTIRNPLGITTQPTPPSYPTPEQLAAVPPGYLPSTPATTEPSPPIASTPTTPITEPQPSLPTEADSDKITRAAKELGIPTEGKTLDEIKNEISKALQK